MGVYNANGGFPRSDNAWAQPKDLLPYQVVSLYLNQPLSRIKWKNYAILPDGNVADLTVAREYLGPKNENVDLQYYPGKNKWTGTVNNFEKNVSPYVTVIPVYSDGSAYRFDYTTMSAVGQGTKSGSKAPPPIPKASAGTKTPPPLPNVPGGRKTPPPIPKT
jgi:hypothetical protein